MKRFLLIYGLIFFPSFADDYEDLNPIWRLNTEMHSNWIISSSINNDKNIFLTTSTDGTAKLWNIKNGKLLKTFWFPLDKDIGKTYLISSIFLSDKKWVAISKNNSNDGTSKIFIINWINGNLIKELNIDNGIKSLCYSSNAKRLAIGGFSQFAEFNRLILLNTEDWSTVANLKSEKIETIYDCKFANNELITLFSSKDSSSYYLNIFDENGNLKNQIEFNYPERLNKFSLKSDSNNIAINAGGTKVKIYRGTLKPLSVNLTNTDKINYSNKTDNYIKGFMDINWSIDGKILYAGGYYQNKDEKYPVIGIKDDNSGDYFTLSPNDGIIHNIFTIDKNHILSVSRYPDWLLQNTNGEVLIHKQTEYINPKIACTAFQINEDGQKIYLKYGPKYKNSLNINLENQSITANSDAPTDVYQAKTEGLAITDWYYEYNPKLDGKVLIEEKSRCLAISEQKNDFFLATDKGLKRFSRDGKLIWENDVLDGIYAVNISKNKRFVVALSKNGIIRWYNFDDGKERLNLFVNKNTLDWIMWTPDGYFDASANGGELIGWTVNRDFYSAKSLAEKFHKPEKIRAIFTNSDKKEDKDISVIEYLKTKGEVE